MGCAASKRRDWLAERAIIARSSAIAVCSMAIARKSAATSCAGSSQRWVCRLHDRAWEGRGESWRACARGRMYAAWRGPIASGCQVVAGSISAAVRGWKTRQ
jgi:hypothetical protein